MEGNNRPMAGKHSCGMIALAALLLTSVLSGRAFAQEPVYSDQDLMVATQIAYYDFTREQLVERGGSF